MIEIIGYIKFLLKNERVWWKFLWQEMKKEINESDFLRFSYVISDECQIWNMKNFGVFHIQFIVCGSTSSSFNAKYGRSAAEINFELKETWFCIWNNFCLIITVAILLYDYYE